MGGRSAGGTRAVNAGRSPDPGELAAALERGDHEAVLRLTSSVLGERPGDDAAHEFRARALLALGRTEEAERHAADAVRLDPDEIRYRELLAQVLSRAGAHREAAGEFGRLARNDPRQADWIVSEARERIDAAQASMGAEAARRAVRLDPDNGRAHLALAQALTRNGDARGAMQAAARATGLMPEDPSAREVLGDALWLSDHDPQAFEEFRGLARSMTGADRDRVIGKAQALYRQHAGLIGRALAGIRPIFGPAFRRGWLRIGS